MELPAGLRQGIDELLEGTPLSDLQQSADLLSRRYRSETRDGRLHVSDALAAKAYLATRLPATYAAIRMCLAEVAERSGGDTPSSLLDVGSGPGTALWAAMEEWPDIAGAELVEASKAMQEAGQSLARHIGLPHLSWRGMKVEDLPAGIEPADLVTLCYVLDELAPATREVLIDRVWALTAGTLVIVEPGTPAGWRRILAARTCLIERGAYVVAPCPHQEQCPIETPDWCHFSRRVARSRLHRLAKSGDVPWEDEKFIYLAVSRKPRHAGGARVLTPPRTASGVVRLKLCRSDGAVAERLVTRRQGQAFKTAKRLDWGDWVAD